MERVKLVVKERTESGSRAARRMRNEGQIPAVLYGAGKGATAILIDARALREAMSTPSGRHAVLDVLFEGKKRGRVAVVHDMQVDKVTQVITHIDLHEIPLDEPIDTRLAVHVEGTSRGVKAGGVLDVVSHDVAVRGLPADIPEHLVVDVSDVEVGQMVRVKDLVTPDGITVLDDPEEAILHVVLPRVVEEVEAEEAAEAPPPQQPALVSKGGAEESADS